MKKIQSMDRSLKTLLLLVAAVLLVMAIVAPGSYYGVDNLRSMIFQFPEYGIIAYGAVGFPRFKSRKNRQSFQCPQHCSVDFAKGTITIPKAKDIENTGYGDMHLRYRLPKNRRRIIK